MRRIATLIITSAMALSAALIPLGRAMPDQGTPELRPCLTDEAESAWPCYWDARSRGNGTGHSFVILDLDGDGYASDVLYQR